MALVSLFLTVIGFLSMTLAAPHSGMVDNEHVRDVGTVYSKAGYAGNVKFLLEVKDEPTCMLFDSVMAGSIQVCVPIDCAFYTSTDCGQAEGISKNDFTIVGPSDLDEFPEHLHDLSYGSYACVPHNHGSGLVTGGEVLKTTPHQASKDSALGMN